ncbi:FecR family protein [Sphingobacterium sp. N143]|uniref:FecR family protein n=1 Tax=Sphingobacterium sp. N143 TaxID=2746727 RepID=UPI002575AB8E|nr:FecR family protein [Sphingobacterium sp. N143]MDM1294207.1 FecR family protein [Sphingobacterium sp. N143]
MEQIPQHIIYLLSKSKLERLSADEKQQLDSWLSNAPENRVIDDMVQDKLLFNNDLKKLSTYDWERSFQIFEQEYLTKPDSISFFKRAWFLKIAAVFIGFMALFFAYYIAGTGYQESPDPNIHPAKTAGMIYLNKGDSIALNTTDTLVALADISNKRANNKENLLVSTPKGAKLAVLLPDGTKVWMNAETQLDYYETDSLRQVRLSGEAYFEVAKKYLSSAGQIINLKPFTVQNGKINVTVLGTHFNVRATRNEHDFKATLYEGKVKVQQGQRQIILSPGQEVYMHDGQIERRTVDLDMGNALREGYFVFNSESLSTILKDIAAWYNVDVVYLDQEVKTEEFEGMLSRNSSLKDIINVLESTGKVKFKFKGKTIYVDRKQPK